jgi:hypothetical protein
MTLQSSALAFAPRELGRGQRLDLEQCSSARTATTLSRQEPDSSLVDLVTLRSHIL